MRLLCEILSGLLLTALSAGANAQTAAVGLSEVRSHWIENPLPEPTQDFFAVALAAGDFNGDARDDLAVGATAAELAGMPVGAVVVYYGAAGGGFAGEATTIRKPGEEAELGDLFGRSLAAGDFDHDGFEDLAVGIPGDGPGLRGAVRIYYGGAAGVGSGGEEVFDESAAGEPQHQCDVAHFGHALAVGDFDGDSFSDLAIGADYGCERIGDVMVHGGSVFVAHGSAEGLVPFTGYRMSQGSFGFDPVEEDDLFGYALAAGDFDADGFDDLAVGIPHESDHGAIQIVMGSEFGLLFADNATWYPGALGEEPEAGDELGFALAAGDFDGDGHDDLAIGDPYEDVGGKSDTGSIDIAYGSAPPAWFDLGRTDRISQADIFPEPEQAGPQDFFGWALSTGDFDGDGYADLAIGQPRDDWAGDLHGGATVLLGLPANLATTGRYRFVAPGFSGIAGSPQEVLSAGWSLGAGDFDGDGFDDLAIGCPWFWHETTTNEGAVAILHGALFADGFEIGEAVRWSATVP